MKQLKRKKNLSVLISIFVLGLFAAILIFTAPGAGIASSDSAEADESVYLPLISKSYPWPSPFGVETRKYLTEGTTLLKRATDLGARWMRLHGKISWRELQPNEGGAIDWSLLADFEDELRAYNQAGITPVVVVSDHPRWATAVPDSCTAIRADKFDAFAGFMTELVKRYGTSEFNVHHWEMGNEPDIDPKHTAVDSHYGCWGDADDPYYGGQHYGNMLKVVTPAIKAADRNAQVWVGGLLLNSPNTPNPDDGRPELFLEGILLAGAGPYFDILPYHAYMGFNNKIVDQDTDVPNSAWYSLGGVVLGKGKYLQQILDKYEVEKPLFINEIALNCPEYYATCSPTPTDTFWDIQANQLVRSMVRGLNGDLMGFVWYHLEGPGWRNGGLLESNKTPRKAYLAYQQMVMQLDGYESYSTVDYGAEVESYAFRIGSKDTQVVWAKEDLAINILVSSADFIEAYDLYGNVLPKTAVGDQYQIEVGFAPVYILLNR